jgi:hypothetical protein
MKHRASSLAWSFLTLLSTALCLNAQTTDSVSQVPEPGSIILLGTVAAGIGFAAWRKNHKK